MAALITAAVIALILIVVGGRSLANLAIEIAWWKELGQFETWLSMPDVQRKAPLAGATLLMFVVLWIAQFLRALKFAGISLRDYRIYAKLSTLVLLVVAYFVSLSSIDTWTVVRFAGSRGLPAAATAWHDAVFDKPLSFYLFGLPFYDLLRGYVLALAIVSILVYWLVARAWQLRYRFPMMRDARELDPSFFRLEGGFRIALSCAARCWCCLLAMAVKFYLGRYQMVYNEHGSFLVGVDYVDQYIGIPLQWLLIAASLAAAAFIWAGLWRWAASMALALVVAFVLPRVVSTLYVSPNEISLERPYIQTHIHATRTAFGLEQHVRTADF